ncbi:hypothetical protein BJ912DRAFT_1146924 [Pholiota molesta]|nr:hypothetical protein BJ912DRAFT_1146924 [Pholiota molesta]
MAWLRVRKRLRKQHSQREQSASAETVVAATSEVQYPGPPPPIPPLPLDVRIQEQRYNTPSVYELDSPPHFENPLIAPRPHRLDRSIPANMARTLDDQIFSQQAPVSAPIQQQQQQQPWSPWTQPPSTAVPAQQQRYYPPPPPSEQDFAQSLANLSMAQGPTHIPPSPRHRSFHHHSNTNRHPAIPTSTPQHQPSLPPPQHQSSLPPPDHRQSLYQPPRQQTPSSLQPAQSVPAMPALTAPLPNLAQLQEAAPQIQNPAHDPALRIAWCRDVLFLVERASGAPPSTDPPVGPVVLTDPTLERLARIAVQIALQLAGAQTEGGGARGKTMAPHVAEATAIRAGLAASGAFPDLGGFPAAWFRLGRDYENFNDHTHAKECFERGAKANVESCLYRMGMAHLLGQLSLPATPAAALPLLHRAATLASLATPQPAYVYALLLLAEFTQVTVPPALLAPLIPAGSSPTLEARTHLERAAYLHFGAAQYKLGHAYEFAEPPFPFDPLLSVQYYSLASQQGEVEADMALSKWFLCGSGGAAAAAGRTEGAAGGFEKDEGLARTFAEKAARKGLPSAEFAMGYYAEVGVGQQRDLGKAMEWYQLAKSHGNADATARLQALSQPAPQQLSRQEHDAITETKLVRRRTQAAQRSETQPLSPPWEGTTFPTLREAEQQAPAARRRPDGRVVVDGIRKNSLGVAAGLPIGAAQAGGGNAYPGRGRVPGLREQSPQRVVSGPGAANAGTASPQRLASPARRAESPGRVVGGRAPSPGRRLGASASGGRPDSSAVGMTSLTRLERMRLNLDDPSAALSPSSSSTSLAQSQSQASSLGAKPYGNGYALSDAPASSLPSAAGPMATPRPVQTPATATPVGGAGSKKPQTFAEMGIQGAKAEDKDCVIM